MPHHRPDETDYRTVLGFEEVIISRPGRNPVLVRQAGSTADPRRPGRDALYLKLGGNRVDRLDRTDVRALARVLVRWLRTGGRIHPNAKDPL